VDNDALGLKNYCLQVQAQTGRCAPVCREPT